MARPVRNRALVIDDDDVLRGIVRRLVDDVGYDVVAEVDSVTAAVDALSHSEVDMIILDLAPRAGRGEELLEWLTAQNHAAKVVVFSAFIGDSETLVDAGADVAIDKPDFNRLEEVLHQILTGGAAAPPERRRAQRDTPPLPEPTGTTPSGFEPWASFTAAVAALSSGDAMLAVDVMPTGALRAVWDDVYRVDNRIAVARSMVGTRRSPDRVSLAPDGIPVLLLTGGRVEAPLAAFDRLADGWEEAYTDSVVVGVFAHVNSDGDPKAHLDEVLGRLRSPETGADSGLRSV